MSDSLCLLSVLFATLSAFAGPSSATLRTESLPAAPLANTYSVCTPKTLAFNGSPPQASRHPIAEALSKAGPGSLIELQAGVYEAFTIGFSKPSAWNANTSGGFPSQPILVRAVGEVRIRPGNAGDTIAIAQAVRCGNITFEGLTIECGYRAGIMFYKCGPNEQHDGFRFIDCSILGNYDHAAGSGANSKWGVWGHSLKDFEFRGVKGPAVVRDIKNEHAFYLQNARGDITIENVHGLRLGRTFVQFTARASDGAPGVGDIRVERCYVEDACIAPGDNYKGGSAMTVAGRHTGSITFKNNRVRSGFNPALLKLTRAPAPFGTGAFVAWDGGGARNGTLILESNTFEYAEGCGDRPLVQIAGCQDVRLVGANRFLSGNPVALELDGGNNNPNVRFSCDPKLEVRGALRIAGRDVSRDALLKHTGTGPAQPATTPTDKGR